MRLLLFLVVAYASTGYDKLPMRVAILAYVSMVLVLIATHLRE